MTTETFLIALAWAGYGGLHSLLAAQSVKEWILASLPSITRFYRLGYNLLATALLIPLVLATEWAAEDWLWRWQGIWSWVAHAATALVMVGFMWSSRAYDMRSFLGLSVKRAESPARFGLSPLHRWVRHPWYTLGLLWLWTRDMDSARLAAALTITLYVWLGANLEDRKLEREWGARYRDYASRIPGLLPRPWRYLSRAEYERLQR
jgi:protein-S-isoprenylcysteine O-methyltransferase Ste14